MEFNENFKSIWIPKEIWYDKNLSTIDKLILMEIDRMTHCSENNEYFARFFRCSKNKVIDAINKLNNLGYISISYNEKTRLLISKISLVVKKVHHPCNIIS